MSTTKKFKVQIPITIEITINADNDHAKARNSILERAKKDIQYTICGAGRLDNVDCSYSTLRIK